MDDLERLLAERALVAVDDRRGVQQPPRDDRHLVPARGELRRLPVHVFGDAAELRIVVVRDDRDAHAVAENTLAAPLPSLLALSGRECQVPTPLVPWVRMPTYDYLCENGHRFELVQRFTDDALDTCVRVRRPLQAAAARSGDPLQGLGLLLDRLRLEEAGPERGRSGVEGGERRGRAVTAAAERFLVEQQQREQQDRGEQREQAGELLELEHQLLRLSTPRYETVHPGDHSDAGFGRCGALRPRNSAIVCRFSSLEISSHWPP